VRERAQIEKKSEGGRGCFRGGKIQNSIMQKKEREREKKKAILLSNIWRHKRNYLIKERKR